MHTQLTILCIDDEQLELSLRKMVLEDAGYAVFTATNASKALEVFRVQRIDLVITDTLQGITSHSFAGELRHLSPHLPIMVLSGGSTLPATVGPPDYYLHKLDGPTEMIAKVQHAITGHQFHEGEGIVSEEH
jgi:DNA-binding response OmpR family regulator